MNRPHLDVPHATRVLSDLSPRQAATVVTRRTTCCVAPSCAPAVRRRPLSARLSILKVARLFSHGCFFNIFPLLVVPWISCDTDTASELLEPVPESSVRRRKFLGVTAVGRHFSTILSWAHLSPAFRRVPHSRPPCPPADSIREPKLCPGQQLLFSYHLAPPTGPGHFQPLCSLFLEVPFASFIILSGCF